jgi:hypothetical protein
MTYWYLFAGAKHTSFVLPAAQSTSRSNAHSISKGNAEIYSNPACLQWPVGEASREPLTYASLLMHAHAQDSYQDDDAQCLWDQLPLSHWNLEAHVLEGWDLKGRQSD